MRLAMLCLCGASPTEESTFIDVKRVIEEYAWNEFKSSMGAVSKTFLRRRDFIIEVPLNYYHTEDIEQRFVQRQLKPASSRNISQKQENVSELKTEFRNNTDTNQTYKFRFERTRKAAVNVTFQKGFTLDGKAHLTLKLPKDKVDSKAGEGLNMSLQVTKAEGESFEDTLVLEATSDIAVEKKHTYITGVSLKQIEIAYDFTVETILRMPSHRAPVTIKRRRGGDVVASFYINNLRDVFEEYCPPAEIVEETCSDSKYKQYAVKFYTSGIIEGAQLSNQKIILESKKIDSEDRSTNTMDVPQIVVRPSDLGEISAASTSDQSEKQPLLPPPPPQKPTTSTEKLRDPQSASERRSSFKRFNQFGENYTSLTSGSPETKIMQIPMIPAIAKTPPTPRSASPTVPSSILTDPHRKERVLAPRRVGVRAKSPHRLPNPGSFQGTSLHPTARPKLSKMTSV
ncbi:hypothetical protein LOTGIDRAFT_158666 [Lottia gigantea]|uniref:Uncharacterized protein n=1 Tax=Lottia gigantea TaxID=225164 RepID=V4A476_LOTGI|nr:hypothetical protein LOTGIDRAFT_158666 [Lottia gigantea]ESO98718.1 hypothetical protein LOTGIDRAFT_158666 [Lottia gigantea]